MSAHTQQGFGQLLVDERLIGIDTLNAGDAEAARSGVPLISHLIQSGAVGRSDALKVAAKASGFEFVDPSVGFAPDPAAIGRLDSSVAVSESALPVRFQHGVLVIAVPDPFDGVLFRRLAEAAGSEIRLVLGPADALLEAVRRIYMGPDAAVHKVAAQPADVPAAGEAPYHLNALLDVLIEAGGSDLHLAAGVPPKMRLDGSLHNIEGYDILRPAELRAMVYAILTSGQKEQLEDTLELDASHPVPGRGRFRVNVFYQRGSIGAVMRAIPNQIQPLSDLGMPPVVSELTELPRGLVLVTGATGSGKSTTLASMLDVINKTRAAHIMTVEDPIEFMHAHRMAIVNQREVGSDTAGFATALRQVLRQDPDVILVGEMRDLETIATALTAAETGHLVLATLHTQTAPGSVERIVDVFPPHQQQQVRVQLAESLAGVVTQQLLPVINGRGRIPAVEVMVATPAIRNLIREGKVHQIRSAMQAGGRQGMQTMDASLAELVRAGKVALTIASERAQSVDDFMNLVGGSRR